MWGRPGGISLLRARVTYLLCCASLVVICSDSALAVSSPRQSECTAEFDDIFCGKSCYEVLGLTRFSSDLRMIKAAFRKMGMKYHPAYNWNAVDEFDRIVTAYEVLAKENVKKAYDDYLAHPERSLLAKYTSYWMVMGGEYLRETYLDLLAHPDVYVWPLYIAFVAVDSSMTLYVLYMVLGLGCYVLLFNVALLVSRRLQHRHRSTHRSAIQRCLRNSMTEQGDAAAAA